MQDYNVNRDIIKAILNNPYIIKSIVSKETTIEECNVLLEHHGLYILYEKYYDSGEPTLLNLVQEGVITFGEFVKLARLDICVFEERSSVVYNLLKNCDTKVEQILVFDLSNSRTIRLIALYTLLVESGRSESYTLRDFLNIFEGISIDDDSLRCLSDWFSNGIISITQFFNVTRGLEKSLKFFNDLTKKPVKV